MCSPSLRSNQSQSVTPKWPANHCPATSAMSTSSTSLGSLHAVDIVVLVGYFVVSIGIGLYVGTTFSTLTLTVNLSRKFITFTYSTYKNQSVNSLIIMVYRYSNNVRNMYYVTYILYTHLKPKHWKLLLTYFKIWLAAFAKT